MRHSFWWETISLYKAMAGSGPLTLPRSPPRHTNATCASGWQRRLPEDSSSTIPRHTIQPPAEQAMALADESSPVFLPGFFEIVEACVKDVPKITDAFKSGKGVGWHEHDGCLFAGTERFFRPNYRAHLISEWIPALGGVEAKLKSGASVADVGCGLGTSTILMAQAYPKSKFVGFDYHARSIELAREAAMKAGVSDRVKFDSRESQRFPRQRLSVGCVF